MIQQMTTPPLTYSQLSQHISVSKETVHTDLWETV